MDIYMYRGDSYCPSCAASIMKGLGKHADSGDSNDYPQCAGDANQIESDTPEHCSGCHEFLKTGLTSHGREYARGSLAEYVINGNGRKEVLQQWADFYNLPWPDPVDTERAEQLGRECGNEALAMSGYPETESGMPLGPTGGDWACLGGDITGRDALDSERSAFARGFYDALQAHRQEVIQGGQGGGPAIEHQTVTMVNAGDLLEGLDDLANVMFEDIPWSFGDARHTLVSRGAFVHFLTTQFQGLGGRIGHQCERLMSRLHEIEEDVFVDLEY